MQLHIFEIYSDPSECTNKTLWLGFKDLTDQFEITNHWEEDRQMFVAGLARFALTAVAPRKVLFKLPSDLCLLSFRASSTGGVGRIPITRWYRSPVTGVPISKSLGR